MSGWIWMSGVGCRIRKIGQCRVSGKTPLWDLLRELSFFTGRGPSVCDFRLPLFLVPPFCIRKNILVPLFPREKNFGPPFGFVKKFWSPLLRKKKKNWYPILDPQKILLPPFGPLKKNWSPLWPPQKISGLPHKQMALPPGKNDSSLNGSIRICNIRTKDICTCKLGILPKNL